MENPLTVPPVPRKQSMRKSQYYWALGLYWDNGKSNGNYYNNKGIYWGYIGITEKKMETTSYKVTPSRWSTRIKGFMCPSRLDL